MSSTAEGLANWRRAQSPRLPFPDCKAPPNCPFPKSGSPASSLGLCLKTAHQQTVCGEVEALPHGSVLLVIEHHVSVAPEFDPYDALISSVGRPDEVVSVWRPHSAWFQHSCSTPCE
ncbi:hypothetical protein SUGI_0224010 [Cryptomeria japonica]|nr:hypothetical protein SUGI_0224010 [Cryptomeria japonica]